MNFQDELAKRTEETEKVIRSFLPAEAGFAGTMAQAMNYSMLASNADFFTIMQAAVTAL